MSYLFWGLILLSQFKLLDLRATTLFLPSFEWQNKNSNLVVSAEVIRVEPENCSYFLKVIELENHIIWKDLLGLSPQVGQQLQIRQACKMEAVGVDHSVLTNNLLPSLNIKPGEKGVFMLFVNGPSAETASVVGLDLGFFKVAQGEAESSDYLTRSLPSYFTQNDKVDSRLASLQLPSQDPTYVLLANSQQKISFSQFKQWLEEK